MNDVLVVKLIEIINAEIRSFHELLELMKQEQTAIIDDDLEGIEGSVAAQQEVAMEARMLEVERIQVVGELSNCFNMASGNMTLPRLLEVLESQQSEELARMRETLLELRIVDLITFPFFVGVES